MSSLTSHVALRQFFRSGWAAAQPSVPVIYTDEPGAWSGASGTTPVARPILIPHVQLSVVESDPTLFAFGAPGNNTWRHDGDLLLEVYAPLSTVEPKTAARVVMELCESFKAICRNGTIPTERIKLHGIDGRGPGARKIGEVDGWLKWLAKAPFHRFDNY